MRKRKLWELERRSKKGKKKADFAVKHCFKRNRNALGEQAGLDVKDMEGIVSWFFM